MKRFGVGYGKVARRQMKALQQYIETRSGRKTAQEYVDDLVEFLEGFDLGAMRGAARDDLRPGLRIIGWRKRITIAFEVNERAAAVTIIAIL